MVIHGHQNNRRITSPKEPKTVVNFWEPSIIKQALNETVDSSVYFHIYTSLHLGLKLREICAISSDDIDFIRKVLKVKKTLQYLKGQVIVKQPKTDSSIREILLTQNMLSFFKRRINYQLFMSNKYNRTYHNYLSVFENGDITTDSYITKRFKKDIPKLDLLQIRFHDLRHSCASWLISNDVSLKTVQEILGHAV